MKKMYKLIVKFKKNTVVCTFKQTLSLIKQAEHFFGSDNNFWLYWWIEVTNPSDDFLKWVYKIHDTQYLAKKLDKDNQFVFWIFCFIDSEVKNQLNIRKLSMNPENINPILDDFLIEIRAFDSSYFELFTFSKDFVREISNNSDLESSFSE